MFLVGAAVLGAIWVGRGVAESGDRGGEIPSVLYAELPGVRDAGQPMWLAADQVVQEEGRVSPRLSGPYRSIVESILKGAIPGRCIEVTEFYDNSLPPHGETLEGIVANSELVIGGTVSASSHGFELDEPGQLFRVELERMYQGITELDGYYIFVPAGRFRAGPFEICKSDSRFPAVPQVGDGVVLFVPEVASADEHYLRTPREVGLVVVTGGRVVLPRLLKGQETFAGPDDLDAWLVARTKETAR